MNKGELIEHWATAGVFAIREIDGVLCGLCHYMFTCAIVIGLRPVVFERRYCFPTYEDAAAAYSGYSDVDEHPSGPWIKCKGYMYGEAIDLLNQDIEDEFRDR